MFVVISSVLLNRRFTFNLALVSGAVHQKLEEANEEDKEHDREGHGNHPGLLLLVGVGRPPQCGVQCGSRILQNLLQHFYGRKSGGGGQDHKGVFFRWFNSKIKNSPDKNNSCLLIAKMLPHVGIRAAGQHARPHAGRGPG